MLQNEAKKKQTKQQKQTKETPLRVSHNCSDVGQRDRRSVQHIKPPPPPPGLVAELLRETCKGVWFCFILQHTYEVTSMTDMISLVVNWPNDPRFSDQIEMISLIGYKPVT